MKTTLIIMAAGIGSRFGGGIKQLAKMCPNGEIIMDYSIYDAKEAGFDKVVFIIRKDIEEEFKEVIGNRIQNYMDVEYVFQDINDLPEGFTCPEGRTKPWGTGQAVLCAKSVVDTPYVIINADDYYGKEPFIRILDDGVCPETKWVEGSNYADIGFQIDPRTNRIILMGAIDNLVKGAAGQAVQNMNLLFGYKEQEGLELIPMFP